MTDKIVVEGGRRLSGSIELQGAKNSVLPILAATILGDSPSVLHNCPRLTDVDAAVEILENFGCGVTQRENIIEIDPENMSRMEIPFCLMRKMRSSVIFLGAVLSRMKKAVLSSPGGCELGPRPIDLHIEALRKLGATITEDFGFFQCTADKIRGCQINLSMPSVGATENIMLAAAKSQGITTIINAAKEPEIEDLQSFLNKMGAKIFGAGTAVITIEGVEKLSGAEHTIIPDRIAGATYLCCAAITGGEIELTHANVNHLHSIISLLEETGCYVKTENNTIYLDQKGIISPIKTVQTMPYPGFPTDAQAILMAYLTLASGISVFIENIFESRFKHVGELCRMGADIRIIDRTAIVYGTKKLKGTQVQCPDLRGGAALLVAALAAEGVTEITEISHIARGYENVTQNLAKLGAKIQRM